MVNNAGKLNGLRYSDPATVKKYLDVFNWVKIFN